jgi:hypothetical protein
LGLVPTELVSENRDKQKFFVRPEHAADDEWRRLERIYVLEIDPNIGNVCIDRVSGAEAVRALVDQTYHFHFVSGSRRFRDHLAFCTQLASKVPIYRLRRPPVKSAPAAEFYFFIQAHLESLADSAENNP